MRKISLFSFSVAVFCLLSLSVLAEEIEPSTSLRTYYATANGKSGNDLRKALQSIINGHTVVSYKQLGSLMQWSDTENADGKHVIDIYTDCSFTVSGPITWKSSGSVGDGMNREHTVPQSWFKEQSPMVSDAFHIYPTDCKANNNRSSYLYGEVSGAGTSYSSKKCKETGKLGTSKWKKGNTYTYNGQTYTATTTYDQRVYEPDDEYKGDLARGYFYMATRYAGQCETWSGGAFGNAMNGLGAYTAELLLKWHRLDPVSEKELIRNEAIYGNTIYNKSSYKQKNRNPFIDYPELVEYIWGDKQTVSVSIADLETLYYEHFDPEPGPDPEPDPDPEPEPEPDPDEAIDETPYQAVEARKFVVNGMLYIVVDGHIYNTTGGRVQ